jgi:hypothetical protein
MRHHHQPPPPPPPPPQRPPPPRPPPPPHLHLRHLHLRHLHLHHSAERSPDVLAGADAAWRGPLGFASFEFFSPTSLTRPTLHEERRRHTKNAVVASRRTKSTRAAEKS